MSAVPSEVVLTPIGSPHIESVARFLHTHMNERIAAEQWRRIVATNWHAKAPNHGFMLHSEARGVVGVLCALYADVTLDGQRRQVCNPHTWCVLDAFRKRSIELVVAVIKQPGWHFSMLSPNREGEQIFAFLKFKPASRATRLFPCGLWLNPFAQERVIADPSHVGQVLHGDALQVFCDHRGFDWLRFIALSDGERSCLVVYRPDKFKRLPAATILYISDPLVFARAMASLCTWLQRRRGIWSVLVEQRLLGSWSPRRSFVGPPGHPKFLLSSELAADHVPNIYSELVILNG